MWYGANPGAPGAGGERERLTRELDLLKEMGVTNLRVLGASEGNSKHNTVNPAIQPEPGVHDETVLKGLDFLLSEMSRRRMYAVIYLNSYRVWSGGMSQYVAWQRHENVPNHFLPPYDRGKFMDFSATFYKNEEVNQLYQEFVKQLVERKNTITGITYRNDPAIMSWQPANEPRPGQGESGKQNHVVFSRWIDQTAGYIKSIDPNHLVSTGNEGTAGCIGSGEVIREIHKYVNVDYMTFHLWLLNWRWFDPLKAEETYPEAEKKAIDYIDEHIGYAKEVGKPIVIEEFCIPRDLYVYDPQATTVYRDRYFNKVFEKIYENASNRGPLGGSNFWAWGGYGKARDSKEAVWKKGDDFTGDPPQEPQGRNSVFVSDSTTLHILNKYGHLMDAI
jgi:mannan endo-1,4-beta-mannosidase